MKPERTLGMEIHAVSILLGRRMNTIISNNGAEDITPMHGRILSYISTRLEQGHEIYQRDIETEFEIARSTVTATLKLMEKKGYLRRVGVDHDARLKSIVATELGKEALTRIESSIRQIEGYMREALTPPEYQELMRLLDRLKSVL